MICRGLRSLLIAALGALILVPCAQGANTVTVYILTTGDIHEHSHYLPRIASYIKYMKSIHANVVAFDCGDALTDYASTDPSNGDLWNLKTRGNVMRRAMAHMEYDACIIGNHDECYGMAQLVALMQRWQIPFMGVNLVRSPVAVPFIAPAVRSFAHVSVGVVGTVSTHTWHLPAAEQPAFEVAGVRSGRVTSAINAMQGNANIVVLLTHETDSDDRESADYLYGLAVIAGGHSHTTLYEYRTTQHDSIVKSGFMGRYVSQLEIVWNWQTQKIESSRRELVDMETQPYEDTWVKALLRAPLVKKNDFDGDGQSDLALYDPSARALYALTASGAVAAWTIPCGGNCVPVQGDFDGDGKSDPAVYDQASGVWTILASGNNFAAATLVLGGAGCVPMAADYDGDLATDCAVYEAASGLLTLEQSDSGERVSVHLGGAGCVPAQGYYDGDGLADPAVYRAEDGNWYAMMSASSYAPVAATLGGAERKPVPGYYDSHAAIDPTVYDESSGQWTAMLSGSSYARIAVDLGGPGCTAVPGDYDGDGREDLAVYRAADGAWGFRLSGSGYAQRVLNLGVPGLVPVQ